MINIVRIVVISVFVIFIEANNLYGKVCYTRSTCHSLAFKAFPLGAAECCAYRGYFSSEIITLDQLVQRGISRSYAPNCQSACDYLADPCRNLACGAGKTCQRRRDSKGNEIGTCVCNVRCSRSEQDQRFYCDDQGYVYKTKCHYLKAKCEMGKYLAAKRFRKGAAACLEKNRGCENGCPAGQKCFLDMYGRSKCISCKKNTKRPLLQMSQYICLTNGYTARTFNQVANRVCTAGHRILFGYTGSCAENKTCAQIERCKISGSVCMTHHKTGIKGCERCDNIKKTCSRLMRWLVPQKYCGSDGQTYDSFCHLLDINCNKKIFVELVKPGECSIS